MDFAWATGAGALSEIIGGEGIDGANISGIMKTSKSMLKTLVSPKKIAMYSGKIAACNRKIIKGIVFTMAASGAATILNVARKWVTGSEV